MRYFRHFSEVIIGTGMFRSVPTNDHEVPGDDCRGEGGRVGADFTADVTGQLELHVLEHHLRRVGHGQLQKIHISEQLFIFILSKTYYNKSSD